MADSDHRDDADIADLTFEEAVGELETIVDQIEEGDLTLEASMARHRRGRALLQRCRSMLDSAEQELEQASLEDLDDAAAPPPEADG